MIRPFRLLATAAAVGAVALGVTARFVRAEPEGPVEVAFRDSVPGPARGDEGGEYRLDRLPILSRVVLAVKDQYVDPRASTRSRWWSPRSRWSRRPSRR